MQSNELKWRNGMQMLNMIPYECSCFYLWWRWLEFLYFILHEYWDFPVFQWQLNGLVPISRNRYYIVCFLKYWSLDIYITYLPNSITHHYSSTEILYDEKSKK